MDPLLNALKAAAEPTRLRLLVLCAEAELTVSELTQILGQSQPRISRHLKLLCDAGLLERAREGIWAFYRLAERSFAAGIARTIVDAVDRRDATVALDGERLDAIRRSRQEAATRYFRENAERWHELRALYVPEKQVEAAMLDLLPPDGIGDLLDIGTGTGRILELFASRIAHGTGVDSSREMLAVARANLEAAGLRHCQVRQADLYQLPIAGGSQDWAVVHQVLHYTDRPGDALAEAARCLKPGGHLLVVDFAAHDLDLLRREHAHQRLGFAEAEMEQLLRQAGLHLNNLYRLPPQPLTDQPLTVCLWLAQRPALESSSAGVLS
jgi:ubiquinone/menaquinone biosynthesis C-methylase UbiE